MPNIIIKNIRFNLDNQEDREIYEALSKVPERTQTAFVKAALRAYLSLADQSTPPPGYVRRSAALSQDIGVTDRGSKHGKQASETAKPPQAKKSTNDIKSRAASLDSPESRAVTDPTPFSSGDAYHEPEYSAEEQDIIRGLWSMAQ